MNRNRILAAIGFLCLTAGVLAFGGNNKGGAGSAQNSAKKSEPPQERSEAVVVDDTQPGAADAVGQRSGAIPLRVVYRQLFHHYVTLHKKATELESQGKEGASVRHYYKRQAKLSDKLDKELERVAAKTDKEVERLDKKAKEVIDNYRAQFPKGQIKKGEPLPPAPPELQALQEERNAAVLAGREELRKVFGEEEFRRFDEFVQQNVASKMKPVRFDRQRPPMAGSPRKPERTNRKPSERILEQ